MKGSHIFFIVFIAFYSISMSSETTEVDTYVFTGKNGPFIYSNIGLMNYRGDVGNLDNEWNSGTLLPAYTLGFDFKIAQLISLGVFGQYGHLSASERTLNRNHNFKTTLIGGGIKMSLLLANDYILKSNSVFKPYLFGTINYYTFNVLSDLRNDNGVEYYYWTDGTIRNMRQIPGSAEIAEIIDRNYVYETNLAKEQGFNTQSLGYGIGAGAAYEINTWLNATSEISYTFMQTDYLDGLAKSNGNDGFLNLSLGIECNIGKLKGTFKNKKTKKSSNKKIDFKELMNLDSDNDGVKDMEDWCPNTPHGTKVNKHGCPEEDKNNVPTHVLSDTIGVNRTELCDLYPSLCYGNKNELSYQSLNQSNNIQSRGKNNTTKNIDEIIVLADKNKDGVISTQELYQMIDDFFEGKHDLKTGDLHLLVNYFFEN